MIRDPCLHCGRDAQRFIARGRNHNRTLPKLGSDLGPIIAENQLKLGSETQNQAKRINEIALLSLLRDQGVGGSNPLSPTNSNQSLTEKSKPKKVNPWFRARDSQFLTRALRPLF